MDYKSLPAASAMQPFLDLDEQQKLLTYITYIHPTSENAPWNELGYQHTYEAQCTPAGEGVTLIDPTSPSRQSELGSTISSLADEVSAWQPLPRKLWLPTDGQGFKCPFCSLPSCKREYEVFQHCREAHLDEQIAIDLGVIVKCKSTHCDFHAYRRSRGSGSRFPRHVEKEHAGDLALHWKSQDLDSQGRNETASSKAANDWIFEHFGELRAGYDSDVSVKSKRQPRSWHRPPSGKVSKPTGSKKRLSQGRHSSLHAQYKLARSATVPSPDRSANLERSAPRWSAPQQFAVRQCMPPRYHQPQPDTTIDWLDGLYCADDYPFSTMPCCGFQDPFTSSGSSASVPASSPDPLQPMHEPMLGYGFEPLAAYGDMAEAMPFPFGGTYPYSPFVGSPMSRASSGFPGSPITLLPWQQPQPFATGQLWLEDYWYSPQAWNYCTQQPRSDPTMSWIT